MLNTIVKSCSNCGGKAVLFDKQITMQGRFRNNRWILDMKYVEGHPYFFCKECPLAELRLQ